MKNQKFNPITLVSVFIGSILMGMNAYEQYQAEQPTYMVIFILLSLLLLTLTVYGIVKNKKSSR
ncbi:hypothetical protein [Litchfieldia salsa]|uniref:Uncharacterized protein n=1 Tax=Litchfieldia salsa TaxID=930152 RepID=A0A1H0U0L9_9BACI|nr:hypothetical protein [Litchfieldia salsa]SDP59729.1 hypothetical protein SAMN05216565_10467 [Litchfieldia salsa]